jgi:hypothetical protein
MGAKTYAGWLARRGAWAVAILALVLVLALSACGRGGAGRNGDGTGTTGGAISSATVDDLARADTQMDTLLVGLDSAYTDAGVDLSAQDNESQLP